VQTYEVAQITLNIFENAFLGIPEQARLRDYFERNDCQHVIGRFGKIRCQKKRSNVDGRSSKRNKVKKKKDKPERLG